MNPPGKRHGAALARKTRASKSEQISSIGPSRQQTDLVQLNGGRPPRRHPAAFVDHVWFNLTMGVIVAANCVTIGLEVDYGDQNKTLYDTFQSVFLLVYIIELCLRLLVHGFWAFVDVMTLFDLTLVVFAVIERALEDGQLENGALPTFRLMRLFRLAKTWKVLRLRPELRSAMAMVRRVSVTLGWVVFLLFFILWGCATFTYRAIGLSAEWNDSMDPARDDVGPFDSFDNFEYFGSVERSLLTLLQLLTLSQWSAQIARPILNVYPSTVVFLVTFFFLTTYGLLMCILANVVQDSLESSRESQRAKEEINTEEREQIGRRAMQMLALADTNGSGKLDVHELDVALQAPNSGLRALLEELGVPVLDAPSLIAMMDTNGDKRVNYSEIVEGALRMGDPIDHRDYIMVSLRLENLTVRTKALEARLQKLASSIALIRTTCAEGFSAVQHTVNTADATKVRQRALAKIRNAKPPDPPRTFVRSRSKFLSRIAKLMPMRESDQVTVTVNVPQVVDSDQDQQAGDDDSVDLPPAQYVAPAKVSWPQWSTAPETRMPMSKSKVPSEGEEPSKLPLPAPRSVAWAATAALDHSVGLTATTVKAPGGGRGGGKPMSTRKVVASDEGQHSSDQPGGGLRDAGRRQLLPAVPPGTRAMVRQVIAAKLEKKDPDDPYKLQDFRPSPTFARLKEGLR